MSPEEYGIVAGKDYIPHKGLASNHWFGHKKRLWVTTQILQVARVGPGTSLYTFGPNILDVEPTNHQ